MNYELLLQKAKDANIEAFEIYEATTQQKQVAIFEGKIDNYTSSEVLGISFRGIYNGKQGTAFTEIDDDNQIDSVISQVIQNASCIESDDLFVINNKIQQYINLDLYNDKLTQVDTNEIEQMLLNIEKACLAYDKRITQVSDCVFEVSGNHVRILNSYGLDVEKSVNYAYFVVGVIAVDNNDTQTEYEIKIIKDFNQYNQNEIVEKVCSNVLKKLHSSKLETGAYKVMIHNKAMVSLLSSISDSFNAEKVQKGVSIFKDKLNTDIFASNINIIEDPHRLDGINSCEFDDEGVATYKKYVVKDGNLQTFLHNLTTAKKANIPSTGNGFKASYASSVGIHPTNLYIEAGKIEYDELVKSIDKGVIITDFQGLHAGINTLTMDFSLQSSGFYVENGEIIKPINLITTAGNLIDLLKNKVVSIGSDLEFRSNGIGAPSIIFSNLQISGK